MTHCYFFKLVYISSVKFKYIIYLFKGLLSLLFSVYFGKLPSLYVLDILSGFLSTKIQSVSQTLDYNKKKNFYFLFLYFSILGPFLPHHYHALPQFPPVPSGKADMQMAGRTDRVVSKTFECILELLDFICNFSPFVIVEKFILKCLALWVFFLVFCPVFTLFFNIFTSFFFWQIFSVVYFRFQPQ